MSATTPYLRTAGTPVLRDLRVTFPRVIKSEWLKFWSLRSSWYTLGAAILSVVVLDTVLGLVAGEKWATLNPNDQVASGVMRGYQLAQLLIGVLGALYVTGEYGTGMIRSTFAAVPRRLPVLGAKTAVFGGIALAAMVVSSFVGFFGAQAMLSGYHHSFALSQSGALRVVGGTGVYLTLIGLLGVALGWILRSTAGAISTLVGIVLVLPVLFSAIGKSVDSIAQYLPSKAGGSFITSIHEAGTLSPWTGLIVLCAWVAAAFGLAAYLLRRRDA
jgi:ABC-type transport system involved in multi-copper enzyme maturation permease subunit